MLKEDSFEKIIEYIGKNNNFTYVEVPTGLVVDLVSPKPVSGNFKFRYVQPKPNLPTPLLECRGFINLEGEEDLVMFNRFSSLFRSEEEVIEFLKVLIVCAKHVKIGADGLNDTLKEYSR